MSDPFRDLPDEDAGVTYRPEPPNSQAASKVETVRRRHESELLAIEGVESVASRSDAVVLYVQDEAVASRAPRAIEGVPVKLVVTGSVTAS